MRSPLILAALLVFSRGACLSQQAQQISSSDLGYRLGSIEAKLEAISKDLSEIKTSQNTHQASMAALTSLLDKLETQSTWVFGGLFAITALIVTNIVNTYMSRRRDLSNDKSYKRAELDAFQQHELIRESKRVEQNLEALKLEDEKLKEQQHG